MPDGENFQPGYNLTSLPHREILWLGTIEQDGQIQGYYRQVTTEQGCQIEKYCSFLTIEQFWQIWGYCGQVII